jgi:hypothetical protein
MTERSEASTGTTSVLIPKPVHRRLKKWAKDRGMKLSFVAEQAVVKFMAETGGSR